MFEWRYRNKKIKIVLDGNLPRDLLSKLDHVVLALVLTTSLPCFTPGKEQDGAYGIVLVEHETLSAVSPGRCRYVRIGVFHIVLHGEIYVANLDRSFSVPRETELSKVLEFKKHDKVVEIV
jgi:hypothetical protein